MRLSRWDPFVPFWNQVQQLQSDLNRVLERWDENGFGPQGLSAFPPLNVWEDDEAAYVEAELPGLDRSDIEVYVTGDQLTLKGERKPPQVENAVWHRQERGSGAFARTVTLPYAVDAGKVSADFNNGVLLVRLPKHEAARPRKITVTAE
jgi:HSP20 family protein